MENDKPLTEALDYVKQQVSLVTGIPKEKVDFRKLRSIMKTIQYGNKLLDFQETIEFRKAMNFPVQKDMINRKFEFIAR